MASDGRDDYRLIDFGEGRKLEKWGPLWLDRPSPAAQTHQRRHRQAWSKAHGRYEKTVGQEGRWRWMQAAADAWNVRFGPLLFELSPTPFGHVGLFPEQASNWKWIQAQVELSSRSLRVLNLFAYTGASTLASAGPRHEVVHVDASRSSVSKARRNAQLSGRSNDRIRWIVEDALKFCRRELRRGNRYEAIILDPPTYGHGPTGERWEIDHQLSELLDLCSQLWTGQGGFLLLTSHSESMDVPSLSRLAGQVFSRADTDHRPPKIEAGEMNLLTDDERILNCGRYARWTLEAISSC